ncbi:MAG: type II toxin-antitoxin system VapC family toxin [Thaumarchaeota archaeon]|nr:type II toxin-antitoxin system VapC family toxin [Nitrososphaerota archaeon]
MKIFLDTSVLSDDKLSTLTEEIVKHFAKGDQFYVSSITHFQIMWGYSIANRTPEIYEEFLKPTRIEIAPLMKIDAENAAQMKPVSVHALDALIASTVKKYGGTVWTFDKDFLKFLSKSNVRMLRN